MSSLKSVRLLLILLPGLLQPNIALADAEDAFQFFAQEAPMVQGISKHAESVKETPMSTYVVTREEMQRWGVRDIDDIFGRVPGYSFYSTDFYGQYGPIARGLQSVWRSGFSVELMPIVDFGHLSSLSPNMFKTIEVARGPAGGLSWGSSAEAGLLNLNLRDDLNGGEVVADVGNYGRQSVDVMYGKQFQKKGDGFFVGYHEISQNAQATHSVYGTPAQNQLWRSDGIDPSYSAIGKFQSGAVKVLALSEHDDHIAPTAWFGSPTPQAFQQAFQQAEGQNLHDEMDTLAYRAEIHAPIENDNYSLYLYHDYWQKRWYVQGVALDTQGKREIGFNSSSAFLDKRVQFNVGGNFWGENSEYAPSLTSKFGELYGINWYDSTMTPQLQTYRDLYIQTKFAATDQLTLILGGRGDYQREAQPHPTLFSGPQGGVLYAFNKDWTAKYLYNDTDRRPQANELSPNVTPETLSAHEISVSGSLANKLKLDVTLFTQKLSNEITRANNPALLNSFYNTGGIKTSGVEWALQYFPISPLLVYWNGSYDHAKVNTFTVTQGTTTTEVSEAHNSSDQPLFVPEITSFVGAEVTLPKSYKVNMDVRSVLQVPYIAADGTEQKTDGTFLDLTLRTPKVTILHHPVEASFNMMNILNDQHDLPAYGEHAGNPDGTLQPEGRRYYFRLSVGF
jgi:hypothetical protein